MTPVKKLKMEWAENKAQKFEIDDKNFWKITDKKYLKNNGQKIFKT